MMDDILYMNEGGKRCVVLIFEDGSAAITGECRYIIERSGNAADAADKILTDLGYKKVIEGEGKK